MACMLLFFVDERNEYIVKRNLCFPDESRITCEILSYLEEHPEAEDTIDGIIQWWLLERKIRYQQKKVQEALSELAGKGFILERRRGSRCHYRMNREKGKEIEAFIREFRKA